LFEFLAQAYAGSNGMLNMTALYREQWFGVAGRPQPSTFSIHSPLRFNNVGLGFTAVNDIVGPIQSTKLYGDFSYTLKFKNNKGKLAFGIKGGVNVNSSKTDQLSTSEGQDQALLDNVGIVISPSFGVGVYYHMPK